MRCRTFTYRFLPVLLAVFSLAGLSSCEKEEPFSMDRTAPEQVQKEYHHFQAKVEYDKVMILYQVGFNDLVTDLNDNLTEILEGELPRSRKDVLLVYRRVAPKRGAYSEGVSPVLMRILQDQTGALEIDTLKIYPSSTMALEAETVRGVLTEIRDRFPCDHYGLILSSHGTGWLPNRYYANPSYYESRSGSFAAPMSFGDYGPIPCAEYPFDHVLPAVRSFGKEYITASTNYIELDIDDLAEAIPMHLDYLCFDACLMGTVEVAYQLKDVCDFMGSCPTEILVGGMCYKNAVSHLLLSSKPDVATFLKDTYDRYQGSGSDVTVSLVDCSKLDALAAVCKDLASRYRNAIMNLDIDTVQQYYRESRYYFFDVQDVFVRAGINSTEAAALQSAMSAAVTYKAATTSFLGIPIERYSGLAMYLPSIESAYPRKNFTYLNNFYRTRIAWNDAVSLVL